MNINEKKTNKLEELKHIQNNFNERIKNLENSIRDIVIAIDAGHGGKYPGAVGPNNILEKDVTLLIAKELERTLRDTSGYYPVMIRSNDETIDLNSRYQEARKKGADALGNARGVFREAHLLEPLELLVLYQRRRRPGCTETPARCRRPPPRRGDARRWLAGPSRAAAEAPARRRSRRSAVAPQEIWRSAMRFFGRDRRWRRWLFRLGATAGRAFARGRPPGLREAQPQDRKHKRRGNTRQPGL